MFRFFKRISLLVTLFLFSSTVFPVWGQSQFKIDTSGLPILDFGTLLTFLVRMIFIVAGLAALFYGLLGGIAWITSGGGKEEIQAARDKIQAAIVGIFILIIVLTVIWTLETVVFKRAICFGISCNIRIPDLAITPLPVSSCNEFCADGGVTNGNYRGGNCQFLLGYPRGAVECPGTQAAENPPSADDHICVDGTGNEGLCCCILPGP